MGSRRGEIHRNITNARVMDLILDMSSRTAGMTTAEITQKYAIDRATAGRWLTSVTTDYGYEVYEIDRLWEDHHRTKRWKIRRYGDPELLGLPEMDQARAKGLQFHRHLDSVERRQLERLRDRLEGDEKTGLTKLLADAVGLDGLAMETERLISQTAYTASVGVKIKPDEEALQTIEYALSNSNPLTIKYRAPNKLRATTRTVRPLGILYGRFPYLVASRSLTGKIGLPIQYRIDLIQEAEEVDDETFELPDGYDFKAWANESFGVQHGRVHTFQLTFKKSIADRARAVQFHPSQKVISKSNREGEYVIEITCSGHQEVFHELCHPDWLGRVSLRGEPDLMDEYGRYVSLVSRAAA